MVELQKIEYSEHIIEVLKSVSNAIRLIGHKKFIALVNKALVDVNQSDNLFLIDFVLNETSKCYGVTVSDILNTSKRGRIDDARRMCFVLFYKHIKIDGVAIKKSRIAEYFNRNRCLITSVLKEFECLKNNIPISSKKLNNEFLNNFNELDKKINNHKTKLK